jgi:hypothetical protein
VGGVCCMRCRNKVCTKLFVENLKRADHLESLVENERMILKSILKVYQYGARVGSCDSVMSLQAA